MNREKLLEAACTSTMDAFGEVYQEKIGRHLNVEHNMRNPIWTESIAVGSEAYIRKMTALTGVQREKLDLEETNGNVWILKEHRPAYS